MGHSIQENRDKISTPLFMNLWSLHKETFPRRFYCPPAKSNVSNPILNVVKSPVVCITRTFTEDGWRGVDGSWRSTPTPSLRSLVKVGEEKSRDRPTKGLWDLCKCYLLSSTVTDTGEREVSTSFGTTETDTVEEGLGN